ncbi:hypothetical protein JXD38_01990 [candidate division WOR-3 bacterium]|nr:hypothetical protein [candidate division WOR-3 bacterium]
MKRLLPLLLLLFGACTEKVEVTIVAPSSGWEVYGEDTIRVALRPSRNVSLLELMIDSAVVGADTFPGPVSSFVWNVAGLPEAGVHRVQARATSGSHEYLSSELTATVGYRSRLLLAGTGDSLWVYRPDGRRDTGFVPLAGGSPVSPRFVVGCDSVVFLSQHRLYAAAVPAAEAQLVDSVENGIYSCDVSPVSHVVAFEGYPAAVAHLFTKAGSASRVQLTHDSDFVMIDSSRFTCIANSAPVFSADGGKLAYFRKSRCLVAGDPRENETREDVFVMNSNGSNPMNLTATVDDAYFSGFTWTFDGKWVLFRAGTGQTPDAVYAANLNGRVIAGLAVSPVAMACSPTDSTLVYIGAADQNLYSAKLTWTADTLYPVAAGTDLADGTFGSYVDWVKYSGQ